MIRFNNDYNRGAHPAVLEALERTNDTAFAGYGTDECCRRAADLIRARIAADQAAGGLEQSSCTVIEDLAVHFLVGGTQTNFTVISHVLRPWQSVIAADSAHINVHETGAVEHIAHKIQELPAEDGKITAEQIAACAHEYETSPVQEHITQPAMVYLSFPTETGTLYSRAELEAIRAVCDRYDLVLFIDGARMGYGLGSPACDMSLADFARLADAFWIGGTKCGALFGEALVVSNPVVDAHFRSSIKQNGGMLAKGWLLGLQFAALFENDLYFDICKRAVTQALRIRDAFHEAGIPSEGSSPTNQQFVVLTDEQAAMLAESYIFEDEGHTEDGRQIARFCTSWGTSDEEVDTLIADIANLP